MIWFSGPNWSNISYVRSDCTSAGNCDCVIAQECSEAFSHCTVQPPCGRVSHSWGLISSKYLWFLKIYGPKPSTLITAECAAIRWIQNVCWLLPGMYYRLKPQNVEKTEDGHQYSPWTRCADYIYSTDSLHIVQFGEIAPQEQMHKSLNWK